jgi:hypothetical protein
VRLAAAATGKGTSWRAGVRAGETMAFLNILLLSNLPSRSANS